MLHSLCTSREKLSHKPLDRSAKPWVQYLLHDSLQHSFYTPNSPHHKHMYSTNINTLCSLRIFIFNHGELSYFHSWPLMLEWVFWFSPQKKVFAPRYLNWEGIRCAFVGLLDHPTCKTILILWQNIFALLFGDGLPLPMKETTPLRVSFCPLWKNFKSHALNIFCRI